MVVHNWVGVHQESHTLADLASGVTVLLDDGVLLRRQLPGLLQDRVRHYDLAHVVKCGAQADHFDFFWRQRQFGGDDTAVLRQSATMIARVRIAALNRLRER